MGLTQSQHIIDELEIKETQYKQKIINLKHNLSSLEQKYVSLDSELQTEKQNAKTLAIQNAELAGKRNNLQLELDDVQDRHVECEQNLENLVKVVDELRATVNLLEEEKSLNETKIIELEQEQDQDQERDERVEVQLKERSEELFMAEKKIEELTENNSKHIENLQGQIRELETEKESFEDECAAWEDEEYSLNDKLEEMTSTMEEMTSTLDNFKKEKQDTLSNYNVIEEQYKELNEKYVLLKNENDDITMKNERMHDTYKNKVRKTLDLKIDAMLERKIRLLETDAFKQNSVQEVMDSTWIPNQLEERACESTFDIIIQNVIDILGTNDEK